MDKEVQFVGVRGILKESVKLLIHHARLLLSLAAILVLPLCFILAYPLVTGPLAGLVARMGSKAELFATEVSEGSSDAGKRERELYSEFGWVGLVLLIYVVFVLAFSLVSTAAIVYSVACIYLEKKAELSKILTIVPRVWKRLVVTFLWKFLIIFACQTIFVVSLSVLGLVGGVVFGLLFALLAIAFLAMQLYISVVWYLANVITVLEERYGIAALKESARIVKGKRLVGCCLILIHTLCTGVIVFIFQVVSTRPGALLSRLLLGSLLVLAITLVHLISVIVQGLFYFMVKSYHQESIDRMVLSDHLDAYLAELSLVDFKWFTRKPVIRKFGEYFGSSSN